MAIDGWTGATRVVEGVGECPELTNMIGEVLGVTKITKRLIYGILGGESAGTVLTFRRSDGQQRGDWARRIRDDRLAELNALADAQHGGTWRATPDALRDGASETP